jgi:hypothetical protein
MDTTTILIIIGIVILVAMLIGRNRVAPRGTYDDKNTRSGGSIGGGPGANDDPNTRSGGSIGGGARTYDSPDHRSSGTIGGASSGGTAKQLGGDERERPRNDDPNHRSGGSIGGN